MPDDSALEPHRQYLEKPPDEFLARKLALFGLDARAFAKAPSIVLPKRTKEVSVHPGEGFKPKELGKIDAHVRKLQPKSIEELKELAGVPASAFQRAEARAAAKELLRPVDAKVLAKLPARGTFAKLRPEQKQAVWDTGYNLLHGPIDRRMLERRGYDRVIPLILKLAGSLRLFLAQDLVVLDGQRVSFTGFGVLYFNNVLVYGSGTISPGASTKLHAYSIQHV